MPTLTISPVTAANAEAAYKLFLASAEEQKLSQYLQGGFTDFRKLFVDEANGLVDMFVCYRKGQPDPIGFVACAHSASLYTSSRFIYMRSLYVTPAERKNGVARFIIGYVADLAKRTNCGSLRWDVMADNHAALAFYERMECTKDDQPLVYFYSDRDEIARLAGFYKA